jgi:effector-binding domain-containing protein
MLFGLDDIRDMLAQSDDDADMVAFLKAHRTRIDQGIREMRKVRSTVSRLIDVEERAARMRSEHRYLVEEKDLLPIRVAGIRIKGRYADAGGVFATLGALTRKSIDGMAMTLFFDAEYDELDADFECCFPVAKSVVGPGVECRDLEGGKSVTLLHRGAYSTTGSSYAKLFSHIRDNGYHALLPFREVYIKGPGIIFRGNPDRYLTEIQIMVTA